jgi:hypothetical protein
MSAVPEIAALTVDDIVTLNATVRSSASSAATMRDAAQDIAEVLYDRFDATAALIRVYMTVRCRNLPTDLRAFAEAAHGATLEPEVPCLTLLGTTGIEPDWRAPEASAGHRAIALISSEVVRARIPMVAGLLDQLGVDIDTVVDLRREDVLLLHHREYGVFHVAEAANSPLIPAQDFVGSYGIRSVVGCGGGLPSGEIFAAVVFARQPIDERTAELFRTLAYGIKAALVPFTYRVFE